MINVFSLPWPATNTHVVLAPYCGCPRGIQCLDFVGVESSFMINIIVRGEMT